MSPRAAMLGLVGAAACWGISFPLMKAAGLAAVAAGATHAWFAVWSVALRFAGAALLLAVVLALWSGARRLRPTRREAWQAAMLALTTAAGMALQADALAYTSASTSAFLTQFYAVQLPVVVALQQRRLPRAPVWAAVAAVLAGTAILAGVRLDRFELGRGAWETLAAATCFTAQILAVSSSRFAANRTMTMSLWAMAGTACCLAPLALWWAPPQSWAILALPGMATSLLVLTVVSTLGGMLLMFACQRHVAPTVAGVTYASEPVFAAGFAMVVPGICAGVMGVSYANEPWTAALAAGGALILVGVVLVQRASE
jgi:drug/metabolite transporter (DMT)-like permease